MPAADGCEDDNDALLARLFVARRGLAEDAGQALIVQVATRGTAGSLSAGPCASPLQRRKRQRGLLPQALHLDDSGSDASDGPLVAGPDTPAWIRQEAARRLNASTDEALSVTSEVTVETGDDAGSGVAREASSTDEAGSSEDGPAVLAPLAEGLSGAERATLRKYEAVFARLHADLDLLVLRRPRAGEALVALLRKLADGLLFRSGEPRGTCQSPVRGDDAEAETGDTEVDRREHAVLSPLARCCDEIGMELGADVSGEGFAPPARKRQVPRPAVATGAGGSPAGRRQRFATAPIASLRAGGLEGRSDGDARAPEKFCLSPSAGLPFDSRPMMLSDPSPDECLESLADLGLEDAVSLTELKCREALRARLSGLVSAEVSHHFGALHQEFVRDGGFPLSGD